MGQWVAVHCQSMPHLSALSFLVRYGLVRTARVPVRFCYSYSTPVSVRATSNPTRTRSRARIVTRSNWSVPVNGGIVWKCRIGLFRRRAICSCMREVMLKLTMDYKMTKHMLNNCTLKESRTWLLICTRHCYFIPFNHEHPVLYLPSTSRKVPTYLPATCLDFGRWQWKWRYPQFLFPLNGSYHEVVPQHLHKRCIYRVYTFSVPRIYHLQIYLSFGISVLPKQKHVLNNCDPKAQPSLINLKIGGSKEDSL